MITYQDLEEAKKAGSLEKFLLKAIQEHRESDLYKTAVLADLYDRQRNKTINDYVQTIFDITGARLVDFTASNAKLASNFFHRLNTQRATYSLGNGVTFSDNQVTAVGKDGLEKTIDLTEQRLGDKFDTDLYMAGYYALIHGVSYGFFDLNRLRVFKVTQFRPFLDEYTGEARAGVWFHQIDDKRPMSVTFYEEDGYTKYRTIKDNPNELEETAAKRAYIIKRSKAEVDTEENIEGENYSAFPIIPLWGSRLHQSTLIGMQQAIDSFDLIRSGFANDLTDVTQAFWIIENCGGMGPEDIERVRAQLKTQHIINVPNGDEAKIKPYTQEIPFQARKEYLTEIRTGIYEDFGGLDVHQVSADSTNDHLEAAYQPMDENADDFEYQIIDFVQRILALLDIQDTPVFKRNRISNTKEQVEMVIREYEADLLDKKTAISKLPNVSPDEIAQIIAAMDAEASSRLEDAPPEDQDNEEDDEE